MADKKKKWAVEDEEEAEAKVDPETRTPRMTRLVLEWIEGLKFGVWGLGMGFGVWGLGPRPEPRNPIHETRNPGPETRDPRPETRDPRPETRDPNPET